MISRWDRWFSTDNLTEDARILAAPPSQSAARAAALFLAAGKRSVLDLACGVGRDTFYLAECGLQVVGADASFNGLRAARQRDPYQRGPLPLVVGDARLLPFTNAAFAGVYCFGLLHEFTGEELQADVHRVLDEIRRVLQPGGLLIITALAGEPPAGLPAVQLYTRRMFLEALRGWQPQAVATFADIGCTGRADYRVWYGAFAK